MSAAGQQPPTPPPDARLSAPRLALRRAGLQLIGRLYPRPQPPQAPPRSLLLIRPDHLGDLLFVTPALRVLRRQLPATHITLLVGPWSQPVVAGNPDADAVLTCPFPGFERQAKTSLLAPYRLLAREAPALRDRFDTAVILRFDHWWGAWLAAAAGIPRRIGYARLETQPFLTEALPYQAGRHEVEQNATLLEAAAGQHFASALGATRFELDEAAQTWAATWLADKGLGTEQPLIAIHPGAGAAVKQWPAAAWAVVADRLAADWGASIVLTGGPAERPLTAAVTAAMAAPALDAAGRTNLGQLAALYARCALVLGADSGPLHLANAVGAATIHLYGPIPVAKFGPWGASARHMALTTSWRCAPCDRLDWPSDMLPLHACLSDISPEQVLTAAHRVLASIKSLRD